MLAQSSPSQLMSNSIQQKYYNGIPGEYICQCKTCTLIFYGDKREPICPSCEYEGLINKIMKLEKDIDNIRLNLLEDILKEAERKAEEYGAVACANCLSYAFAKKLKELRDANSSKTESH